MERSQYVSVGPNRCIMARASGRVMLVFSRLPELTAAPIAGKANRAKARKTIRLCLLGGRAEVIATPSDGA
jgi:hypothetical protein